MHEVRHGHCPPWEFHFGRKYKVFCRGEIYEICEFVCWLPKAMTEQICRDLLSQFGKLRHNSASMQHMDSIGMLPVC